jgi:hypothetical protein
MHLDALYVYMLSTCVDGETEEARKLLGATDLLDQHSTPALLATLCTLPLQSVVPILQTFVDARLLTTESPLNLVEETTYLRRCHDSFRGFVVNPQRCPVKQYLSSTGENHEALLHRCLLLLNEHLHQNICDIRKPGLSNADVPFLHARIARWLPETMRYACVSWPMHLVASDSISREVSAALLEFCTEHLLHWLEALSLLEKLSSVGRHLPKVIAWCQVRMISCFSLDVLSS